MDQTRGDIALLYRRAGFGARPEELDALVGDGYEACVERLVAQAGQTTDSAADRLSPPAFLAYRRPTAAPASAGAAQQRRAQRRAMAEELAPLQAWWLDRMIVTSNPLREKLTLLWHGHFATGITKVGDPDLMYRQNQTLRRLALGPFEDLTQAVAKDGAMMIWLDTVTDKAAHPNENFARELMELFTLGFGNFSQADVLAAAEGFTGWGFDRVTARFVLRPGQEAHPVTSFLGQRGSFDGERIITTIVGQPASARFVTARLWSHLGYPVAPSDPIVTDLVASYSPSTDLAGLLRAIFLHPGFRSPRTRNGLVKQPAEYLVGAARALGLDARLRPLASAPVVVSTGPGPAPDRVTVARLATALAQTLFDPPNVGGWGQNDYWLTTATAADRLAAALAMARRADLSELRGAPAAARATVLARMLGVGQWGRTSSAALSHVVADPVALVAVGLNAPEFVLA